MRSAMRATEPNLSSALLKLIRRRRFSSEEAARAISNVPESDPAGIRQRAVEFADFEAVSKLKAQLGLSADSVENWHRLWRDNDAIPLAKNPLPKGWVMEVQGRVVGYLGSIPLRYHYGSTPLLAATASGFAVEPAYRAFSIGLVASFYRQKGVDLFLNTTAIESVGRLAQAFQAEALPQDDYDNVLFWILDAGCFLDVIAKKVGVDGNVGTVGRTLGTLAVRAEQMLRQRGPRTTGKEFRVTQTGVAAIGGDFEEIWQRRLAGRPCLLADRDQTQLRWHFTIPGSVEAAVVLRCERDGYLLGYAVVRVDTQKETGLRRALLADLLVENDIPEAIKSLVAAAHDLAKAAGCHVLEVLGFPKNVRRVLLPWKPYSRKYPACPFYFKAKDHDLHKILRREESWYAGPFDGDTTLVP